MSGHARQTDMAKSIFLVTLIKNIYTLWDLTCLLRPVPYILPKLTFELLLKHLSVLLLLYILDPMGDIGSVTLTPGRKKSQT